MSPEFRSLLIKEWTERRNLFLWGTLYIIWCLGYCVSYEVEYRTRAFVGAFHSACGVYSWMAAVLFAMSAATGEYSQKSLHFSASLPVSLSKVAWARLLGMWSCLIGPILVGTLLATFLLGSGFIEQAELRASTYVMDQDRMDLPSRPRMTPGDAVGLLWATSAIAIVTAMYLSTIISLLGTWCRREGTAGFLGAILVLFSLAFGTVRMDFEKQGLFLLADWIGGLNPQSLITHWGYGQVDGSSYADLEFAPLVLGPLALNLMITMMLATWFSWRYGCRRNLPSSVTSAAPRWRWLPHWPTALSRIPIRWPGRVAALVGLDLRLSIPLGLSGLVIAMVLTVFGLRDSQFVHHPYSTRVAGQVMENTAQVGILWGAIVAVGLFSAELQGGLNQFWRSRPISTSEWFWSKFGIGLVVLIFSLDLLPVFFRWITGYEPDSRSGYMPMGNTATLTCMTLLHAQAYVMSVAAICLIRRSIPAAIVGLILAYGMDLVMESIPVSPRLATFDVLNSLNHMEVEKEPLNFIKAGYPAVYGIVFAGIVLATALARRAASNTKATLFGIGASVLMILGSAIPAQAQDADGIAKEIVAGIRHREMAINDVHMRLKTHIHRTGNCYGNPGRRTNVVRRPHDKFRTYDFYEREQSRAWTEFDLEGKVLTKSTFNGSIHRTYSSSSLSAFDATEKQPQLQFPHPYAVLSERLNLSTRQTLPELLDQMKLDSFAIREEGGEKLIEFTISTRAHEQQTFAQDGTVQKYNLIGHSLRVTVNAARSYWPVAMVVEQEELVDGTPRVFSRYETNCQGWIEAGPVVFPRTIAQKNFARPTIGSVENAVVSDLVLNEVHSCELLEVTVNVGIPDEVFGNPFPVGAGYYDMQDKLYHEIDADGNIQPYVPKPKGLQGSVLVYHVTWLTMAILFLFHRQTVEV